jgi:hypothetical protein
MGISAAFRPRLPAALLVLAVAGPGFGQSWQFGIKAGIPLTEYFDTGSSGSLHGSSDYSAATRRYTVGGSIEKRLPAGFGLEMDLLFHRMGYAGTVNYFDSANGGFQNSAIDVNGDSWDSPLMLKHRFGRGIHPYVVGGGVLRYAGPVRGRVTLTSGSLASGTSSTAVFDTSDPSDLYKRFYPGLTAGAGIEARAAWMRLLPEVRYKRWTANISGPGGLLRFAPDQVEILLGISF